MGASDKIVWKQCVLGTEKETAAAQAARAAFAPFDFTLEE
jgi:hypothetical protein